VAQSALDDQHLRAVASEKSARMMSELLSGSFSASMNSDTRQNRRQLAISREL